MFRNKPIILLYLVISILALIFMWRENWSYSHFSFFEANTNFWQDTWSTPASRSITIDLFFLYFSIFIWKVKDAKKKKILKFVPLYLVAGLIIGVSFTTPIYLIHRECAKDGES